MDTGSAAERSRIMAAVPSQGTKPEVAVRKLVHSHGFRFRLHDATLSGKPDLVFKRLRKAIFVHGCFWHMHACGRCRIPATRRTYGTAKLEGNADRDANTRRALRKAGWSVMVIWECEVARPTVKARLQRFLGDKVGAIRK